MFLPSNPDMVMMDTEIIAESPVRLTVAGMGDALATYFEARACQRSDAASCAGGKITGAAMALAKLCFDTLMEEGVKEACTGSRCLYRSSGKSDRGKYTAVRNWL